jgi:hypothetical protein
VGGQQHGQRLRHRNGRVALMHTLHVTDSSVGAHVLVINAMQAVSIPPSLRM